MTIEYERLPTGEIVQRFQFEGESMMFVATQIRMERTGEHAVVLVGHPGGKSLASDNLNVTKHSQRVTLANAAAAQVSPAYGPKSKEGGDLQHELMLFCRGLWAFHIGSESGRFIKGDPEPSAPRWAVVPLILEGAVGIGFGPHKGNKSTLYRLVAISLQHGCSKLFNVTQAPVVWINAEEPPEEHSRQIGNCNAVLGIERTAELYTIDARGLTIHDLAPKVAAAVEKIGAQHIFTDSLSRISRGMNLNDNDTATLLMDSYSGLGPSNTFIGHTGHESQTHVTGSRHFQNAARLLVRIQSRVSQGGVSPELRRGVRVEVMEANGAAPVEPNYFTFKYHRQHGLMAVERAKEEEWPVLQCQAWAGKSECGRRTWDGLTKSGEVRCSRHQEED